MLMFKQTSKQEKRCSIDKSLSFAASTCFSLLKSKILLFSVDQYLTPGGVLDHGLGPWVVKKRDVNYQSSGQNTCLGLAACPLCECVTVSRARASETFCLQLLSDRTGVLSESGSLMHSAGRKH